MFCSVGARKLSSKRHELSLKAHELSSKAHEWLSEDARQTLTSEGSRRAKPRRRAGAPSDVGAPAKLATAARQRG
jgi:hypothetical protein